MNIIVSTGTTEGCGSNSDIRIKLTQDNQTCTTHGEGIYEKGTLLEWAGNKMGACHSINWTINKAINFKLVMISGQEVWCPLNFTAYFERNAVYKKYIGGFMGSKFTGN